MDEYRDVLAGGISNIGEQGKKNTLYKLQSSHVELYGSIVIYVRALADGGTAEQSSAIVGIINRSATGFSLSTGARRGPESSPPPPPRSRVILLVLFYKTHILTNASKRVSVGIALLDGYRSMEHRVL